MIRQPSSLKRLTVAWPIPRLAPVRIRVLECSDMARSVAECRPRATPVGAAPSMRHEQRQLRARQHIARGAPENDLAQPAMAVGAHDQEIQLMLVAIFQQRWRRRGMITGMRQGVV